MGDGGRFARNERLMRVRVQTDLGEWVKGEPDEIHDENLAGVRNMFIEMLSASGNGYVSLKTDEGEHFIPRHAIVQIVLEEVGP